MRQPNKNRSRNKNNRSKNNMGNVVNRVFDSAGPEGKVRGTPSQIIEKYQGLVRDAQLSGDRVAAENFQQHAEHYTRMLAETQRAQDAQNAKREAEQAERDRQQAERDRQQADRREQQAEQNQQRDTGGHAQQRDDDKGGSDDGAPDLVDTPEDKAPRQRRSRRNSRKDTVGAEDQQGGDEPAQGDTEVAQAAG